MLLYLDTNIWNALCDQAVDQEALAKSLASRNASLAFSFHTVYELARTFTGGKSTPRGVQLFSYLRGFLNLRVVCMKEVRELLQEEAWSFEQGKQDVETLVFGNEYGIVNEEVNKLAKGIVEGRVERFIEERLRQAQATRTAQSDHLKGRVDMKEKLKAIPQSELAKWMQSETMTSSGTDILRSHFARMIGQCPTRDRALALLASPVGNVARGLVRADLYYNWRCANRDSNPFDLMDDMLHVLQATYCDIYATAEPKQSEYASLLLPGTRVEIYDRHTPIVRWLEQVACSSRNVSVAAASQ